MGLLEIMQKTEAPASELKIVILGLDSAGKTTILNALANSPVGNETTTQGFNVKTLQHDKFKLSVCDIGGQDTLRDYWANYLQGANALVYVVDSSDRVRFNESFEELKKLLANEALSTAPVLIYCNKQDIEGAMEVGDISNTFDDLVLGRDCHYQHCIATKLDGVEDGMTWLIEKIAEAS